MKVLPLDSINNKTKSQSWITLSHFFNSNIYLKEDDEYCLLRGMFFNDINKDAKLCLKKVRNKYEWLQAYPEKWNDVLAKLFEDKLLTSENNLTNKIENIIELNTRVNFKFNKAKFNIFKSENVRSDLNIERTTKNTFVKMKGSVVPSKFWENAEDFFENGIGFSLYYNDDLATTAYSAFITQDKLELGMETVEKYRGNGFAQHVCATLIDYCIEKNYEPIWACRLDNIGSYKLAIKLGFDPDITLPYYRLNK